MKSLLAVPIFALLLMIDNASACKCALSNATETFCEAKWISRAEILSKEKVVVKSREWLKYNVQHNQVFKTPSLNSTLSTEVLTPPFSATCGVEGLQLNNEYLLAGTISNNSELHIVSCLTFPENDADFPADGAPAWKNISEATLSVISSESGELQC